MVKEIIYDFKLTDNEFKLIKQSLLTELSQEKVEEREKELNNLVWRFERLEKMPFRKQYP
jgi:hypothetical protein